MDRLLHRALVVVGSLVVSTEAAAQSASVANTTAAPSAVADFRIPMEVDEAGVVLYRVFESGSSPLPVRGVDNVDGVFAESICFLPCAPAWSSIQGQEFFFGGEGITSSKRFRMVSPQRARGMRVSRGSHSVYLDGVGLIVFSILPVAFGIVTVPLAMGARGTTLTSELVSEGPIGALDTSLREKYRRELMISGVTSLVLGGVGLAIGIPLYRSGRTTYVQFDPAVAAFRF